MADTTFMGMGFQDRAAQDLARMAANGNPMAQYMMQFVNQPAQRIYKWQCKFAALVRQWTNPAMEADRTKKSSRAARTSCLFIPIQNANAQSDTNSLI